jgi:hypothetical protein
VTDARSARVRVSVHFEPRAPQFPNEDLPGNSADLSNAALGRAKSLGCALGASSALGLSVDRESEAHVGGLEMRNAHTNGI